MSEKPWVALRDEALARYYQARATVSQAEAGLRALGITSTQQYSDTDAAKCSCGAWVAHYVWARPTGKVTCEDCATKAAAVVAHDRALESGELRHEDVKELAP